MTHYIAYRDEQGTMVPCSTEGTLDLYPSLEQAQDAADLPRLGVAVPVSWGRVLEVCKQYNLGIPKRREE